MNILRNILFVLFTCHLISPVLADSSSFSISLQDAGKTLEITLGNTKLPLKSSQAWKLVDDANSNTYTLDGDLRIGKAFSMSTVKATIGPNGRLKMHALTGMRTAAHQPGALQRIFSQTRS